MRNVLILWRREMASYLLSPMCYAVAIVFLAVAGTAFLRVLPEAQGGDHSLGSLVFETRPFWVMFVLVATAITIRPFAEEKRTGTMEMLVTAPVRDLEVVLGKYLAALTMFVLIFAPTGVYPVVLKALRMGVTGLDPGIVVASYLVLFFVGAFYVALGLLVSALTRSQVVAAIVAFPLLAVIFFSGYLAMMYPGGIPGRILAHLSSVEHVLDGLQGVIDTRMIVSYFSGTVFVLFLTLRAVESRRWV